VCAYDIWPHTSVWGGGVRKNFCSPPLFGKGQIGRCVVDRAERYVGSVKLLNSVYRIFFCRVKKLLWMQLNDMLAV
jgi:hypothetical protein